MSLVNYPNRWKSGSIDILKKTSLERKIAALALEHSRIQLFLFHLTLDSLCSGCRLPLWCVFHQPWGISVASFQRWGPRAQECTGHGGPAVHALLCLFLFFSKVFPSPKNMFLGNFINHVHFVMNLGIFPDGYLLYSSSHHMTLIFYFLFKEKLFHCLCRFVRTIAILLNKMSLNEFADLEMCVYVYFQFPHYTQNSCKSGKHYMK